MISNFRSPVILKPKPVPVPSLNCYKPIFYAGARVYVWGGDLLRFIQGSYSREGRKSPG